MSTSDKDNLVAFYGKQINIGVSAIVGVTVAPYQSAIVLDYQSGGTVWIGGASTTVGQGFLLKSGFPLAFNACGTFYMASAGATSVVQIFGGGSQLEYGT